MIRTLIICMLFLATGSLFAQVTSSAYATATIVSEVGITELQGNNVITFASTKHDLQLVNTAGVSMLTNSKMLEILSFKVISNENEFSIKLPSTYRLTNKDNGFGCCNAELFVTSSSNKKNNQTISISTVLKAYNFQTPGNYYSEPFEITINYD